MNTDFNLQLKKFKDINLNDHFFDSLKEGYVEFTEWFHRKADEQAYVIIDEYGFIQGFVYLKEEKESINDIAPPLPKDRYLKIGNFKINGHGAKLGERFIKKAFDHAIINGIKKLYVTVFSHHTGLISLFERYGFKVVANKGTQNGTELVLLNEIGNLEGKIEKDYPIINLSKKQYLLGIYPEYHTRLFPDSIFNNENLSIIDDVSHTNSIEKIYICKMPRVQALRSGDALVIYRTGDGQGPAWYRAVATSLCMVEEVKTKSNFADLNEFLSYCRSRSVFSAEELTEFYNKWNHIYVIKMTYNAALKNRIIRKRLIEEVGLSESDYWGFMELSTHQFINISNLGDVDDSLIFN
ncbi:MAG: N-acetyltransferase family protein [Methylomicrobium sp.]